MIERINPIKVDCLDKPRSLFFTVNAAARIKESLGENPLSWKAEDWAALGSTAIIAADPKRFIAVLHAMLVHEDPTLKQEQVGDMLSSIPQMKEIFAAMMSAYRQYFGPLEPAPEGAESENPSRDQIPTNSGQ